MNVKVRVHVYMCVLLHVVLLLLPSRFHPSQPTESFLLGFITIVSAVCVQRDFVVVYFDFVVLVARRWSFLVSSPAGSPHRAPHPSHRRPSESQVRDEILLSVCAWCGPSCSNLSPSSCSSSQTRRASAGSGAGTAWRCARACGSVWCGVTHCRSVLQGRGSSAVRRAVAPPRVRFGVVRRGARCRPPLCSMLSRRTDSPPPHPHW